MKTLSDFPIGSMWIDPPSGGKFEVIKHVGNDMIIKCIVATITVKVGKEYTYTPHGMGWAQPTKVSQTKGVEGTSTDPLPKAPAVCSCPLWQGCTCGVFAREMREKNK